MGMVLLVGVKRVEGIMVEDMAFRKGENLEVGDSDGRTEGLELEDSLERQSCQG